MIANRDIILPVRRNADGTCDGWDLIQLRKQLQAEIREWEQVQLQKWLKLHAAEKIAARPAKRSAASAPASERRPVIPANAKVEW